MHCYEDVSITKMCSHCALKNDLSIVNDRIMVFTKALESMAAK